VSARAADYGRNVFINCPFDAQYTPLFEAIVFAVHDAGFRPRSAREQLDSSRVRLQKIVELIADSRYSIHDLSRTKLDAVTDLPRFNMPLELGIDLGCKSFSVTHSDKTMLVFDAEPHRFQKFVSDIGGQDVFHHNDDPKIAVKRVRDWLRTESGRADIVSGAVIYSRYEAYLADLPSACKRMGFDISDLTFADFSFTIARWSDAHPP
jgi:hypothetical protein